MSASKVVITNIRESVQEIKLKKEHEKFSHLLPKHKQETITFDIQCDLSLANGLRRSIMNETTGYILDFDESDMKTTEYHYTEAFIRNRINMIPINQELAQKGLEASLAISNMSHMHMIIYSSDLKFYLDENKKSEDVSSDESEEEETQEDTSKKPEKAKGGFAFLDNIQYLIEQSAVAAPTGGAKNKKTKKAPPPRTEIETSKVCNEHYRISVLEAGTFLKIPRIVVKSGTGMDNGVFSQVVNPVFIARNPPEFAQNGYSTKFTMSFTTNGNISPRKYIIQACDELIERFENIAEHLNLQFDNTPSSLVSIKRGTELSIKIAKETHTVGALICRYVYNEDPSIQLIKYEITHPLMREVVIYIDHPSEKEILNTAIEKIIEDLSSVADKFEE